MFKGKPPQPRTSGSRKNCCLSPGGGWNKPAGGVRQSPPRPNTTSQPRRAGVTR